MYQFKDLFDADKNIGEDKKERSKISVGSLITLETLYPKN